MKSSWFHSRIGSEVLNRSKFEDMMSRSVSFHDSPSRCRRGPCRASLYTGVDTMSFEDTKERIRKLFSKVELSVSSYDTAWVAMVPSPGYSQSPCFPECLKWLLDNQQDDGSWSSHFSPLLAEDAIMSTLACILALKRWGAGEELINKGLHFIELNFPSVTDKRQHSPIGFDIIFPGMVKHAKDLDLMVVLEPTNLNAILRRREAELRRCFESHSQETDAYLAYVSEGLGNLQDWKKLMKYQKKNGSLFNSPSTTAAALTYHQNASCFNYLSSVLDKFGNAVPTVYPVDLYVRLCMIDNLERLGIDRHFMEEIQSVLDETYRCWLQRDEQIFADVGTCAMAFRLLRMKGYDVSSDPLDEMTKQGVYFSSPGGHLKDISAVLEVYKASQIIIHPNELALREQNSKFGHILEHQLTFSSVSPDKLSENLNNEVKTALRYPFKATLGRMASRRYIENFNLDGTRILKSSYRSPNICNKDFLKLAVEDFNKCQSIHRAELEYLERWVVESRLDKLKFFRLRAAYCYFSAAATLFPPELSDARISWAKNGILTTVVDDFFDVGGSMEELSNLLHLVEKWNVNVNIDVCSEQVGIIFLAIQRYVLEFGEKAFKWQSRCVTSHAIEIWRDLVKSMWREAVWARDALLPTLDEYMTNAYVSFALGPIVLPALYLVGPRLSEEIVWSSEYGNLFRLMSTIGRLLNDTNSFKREFNEGKLNAVTLLVVHGGGDVAEEDAVQEFRVLIENHTRELLGLVLRKDGSVVPRACKDLFWDMSQVLHLFYAKDDGYTSEAMMATAKAIIDEPISLTVDYD